MSFCHLQDVGLTIAKREILKNCTLLLQSHESTAIIGESGAGKTSLARLICRLVKPSRGTIKYNEDQIGAVDSKVFKRNMQLVFQNPTSSLNPIMSVREILLEPLIIHGLPCSKKLLIEHLEMVDLDEKMLSMRAHELSGGQQQRLCLARALILKPKVLVLDEVTCSLDLYTQAQIIKLLQRLRTQHQLTYIFISHDLALTDHLCDRFIVMHNKTIVDDFSADTLHHPERSNYTKRLLAACQKLNVY
jgi:ABC-type dipeptide/oligopeptide/nickel transport system ATPase subunit